MFTVPASATTTSVRLLFLTLSALAAFAASDRAAAEPLGVELLTTSISANSVQYEPAAPLDEIVVYGLRGSDEPAYGERFMSDALLMGILRDVEMRRQLEQSFKNNVLVSELGSGPRQLRLGYDARAALVEQAYREQQRLPLDIVTPAVVLSISF